MTTASGSEHKRPLVSVCMITYKHEEFIAEAIESVLQQQGNFDLQLVIGDDASPDGTAAYIRHFQQQHPDKIVFLSSEKNIGMQHNFLRTLAACTGDYVAILDGDDYWTNPNKLEDQVSFLETHPDFSICFHEASVQYQKDVTTFYPDINAATPEVTSLEDLIQHNYIHSSTVLLRPNALHDLPTWFETAYPSDWPLFMLTAQYGKIKFIRKTMGVYRVHNNGVHSTQGIALLYKRTLPLYQHLAQYFKNRQVVAAEHFKKLYYEKSAYFLGIQNLNQQSRWVRFKVLILSGFQLKQPVYFLRAMIVLLSPKYYTKDNASS